MDGETTKVFDALEHWYQELVRIGHHIPNEEISEFRSDRWPPEVDLLKAYEEWKGVNRIFVGIEEADKRIARLIKRYGGIDNE